MESIKVYHNPDQLPHKQFFALNPIITQQVCNDVKSRIFQSPSVETEKFYITPNPTDVVPNKYTIILENKEGELCYNDSYESIIDINNYDHLPEYILKQYNFDERKFFTIRLQKISRNLLSNQETLIGYYQINKVLYITRRSKK